MIQPLQSTNGQMHTIRTLAVGRHKQLVMDTCIERIYNNIHCPTNTQALAHTKTIPIMCMRFNLECDGNDRTATIATIMANLGQ